MLIDQLNKFYPIFHDKQFNDSDEFPKPTVFYIDLKNEIIDKVHQNRTPVISFDQKKQEIVAAIDNYAALYILLKEVEK